VGQLPGGGTVDPRVTDNRLFLLGDSVMGTMRPGNTDEARKVLEPLGWKVTLDAADGRFADEAISVLRDRRKDIGQVVVILIGNNYGGDEKLMARQFDTMLALLDGVPRIVFLTVEEAAAKQAEVNAELRRIAADPRVTLVDWNAVVKSTQGANRPDGLHLTPFGAAVLARTIADAVGPAPRPQ
jgi:lysophospholipase L1-like esterase